MPAGLGLLVGVRAARLCNVWGVMHLTEGGVLHPLPQGSRAQQARVRRVPDGCPVAWKGVRRAVFFITFSCWRGRLQARQKGHGAGSGASLEGASRPGGDAARPKDWQQVLRATVRLLRTIISI